MITQIKFNINRTDRDGRCAGDPSLHVMSLPSISVNLVHDIYHIILDRDADLIMAYDKQDPRSIINIGSQGVLTITTARKEFNRQLQILQNNNRNK